LEIKYFDCPFEIKTDSITQEGIFEGYASDYINKKDSYGDIITKGAFTETLKKGGRNGNGIPMLWQHDTKKPIGIYQQIVEQNDRIKVSGKLALGVQQADEAYILAKMGAIKGMSIGWDLLRDDEGEPVKDAFEFDTKNKVRYLKQLDLWEISLVTFPANTRATITSVKSVIENTKNIRDFENALRDEGMSISASKYLAKLYKPLLEKEWNRNSYEILNAIKAIRKNIGGK
jgi:uncharacterized protein